MVYKLKIAGIERDLPLCPLNDELYIAAFVLFGDVELTECCARELVKLAPEHDIMITAESKGIPLICAMARQMGVNRYILARKMPKVYMRDIFKFDVNSITTKSDQSLYLDGYDAEFMRGRRVLIVDDVISTGSSLAALEQLVLAAGGEIAGKITILAEGDAANRNDIKYLERLPLFDKYGNAI